MDRLRVPQIHEEELDRRHRQQEQPDLAKDRGIDPESGLAGTNQRFLNRFSRVEAALGGNLQGRSINELEDLWHQAKAAIREEQQQP